MPKLPSKASYALRNRIVILPFAPQTFPRPPPPGVMAMSASLIGAVSMQAISRA